MRPIIAPITFAALTLSLIAGCATTPREPVLHDIPVPGEEFTPEPVAERRPTPELLKAIPVLGQKFDE